MPDAFAPDLFARLHLPCALYPVARECLACGARHLDTPGGGHCRSCGKPLPEDGSNSCMVRWRDGREHREAADE